jgi:diguanylate cyclase (GGDEF)-like protein
MIFITLEVLVINLVITYFCAKRKYAIWWNIVALMGATVLLYLIFHVLIGPNTGPSVWGIVFGSLFVLPLYVLLDIKIHKLVYIMTFTWLYTLVLSGSSQLLGNVWFSERSLWFALLIQTVLFLLTITFMIRFVQEKVLFLLTKMERNWATLLLFSSSMFVLAVLVRHYSSFTSPYLQVFVLILLLLGSYLFHQVFCSLYQNKISLLRAHELASTDPLTGIGNRYALFQTLTSLVHQNKPFQLVFLDLDRFKTINDQYSHVIGDKYLRRFASIVTTQIGPQGSMYRFAGDEFVAVLTDPTDTFDTDLLLDHVKNEMNRDFSFQGVSLGISRYPDDATSPDALIEVADQRMYENKGYRDPKKLTPKTRMK